MTYVEAARSIGASDWTIIMRHILPGTVMSVVLLHDADRHVDHHRREPVVSGSPARSRRRRSGARCSTRHGDGAAHRDLPSLAIFLTVLAFNLLGDGLRDALDPKLERR